MLHTDDVYFYLKLGERFCILMTLKGHVFVELGNTDRPIRTRKSQEGTRYFRKVRKQRENIGQMFLQKNHDKFVGLIVGGLGLSENSKLVRTLWENVNLSKFVKKNLH